MRTSWIIDGKYNGQELRITESKSPDTIVLDIGSETICLTSSALKELVSINYKAKFVIETEEKEDDRSTEGDL